MRTKICSPSASRLDASTPAPRPSRRTATAFTTALLGLAALLAGANAQAQGLYAVIIQYGAQQAGPGSTNVNGMKFALANFTDVTQGITSLTVHVAGTATQQDITTLYFCRQTETGLALVGTAAVDGDNKGMISGSPIFTIECDELGCWTADITVKYNVAGDATVGDTFRLTMTADDITYTGGNDVVVEGDTIESQLITIAAGGSTSGSACGTGGGGGNDDLFADGFESGDVTAWSSTG